MSVCKVYRDSGREEDLTRGSQDYRLTALTLGHATFTKVMIETYFWKNKPSSFTETTENETRHCYVFNAVRTGGNHQKLL